MPAKSPLVALLLLAAAAVLHAAASAVQVAAGGKYTYRVVIGGGTKGAAGAYDDHVAALMMRRRLEDEVAPEFPAAGGLLGVGGGDDHISYDGLDKDKPGCQRGNQCAAKAGGSYTRPCTYKDQCRP